MNQALRRIPSRREFLILGGASAAALALVDLTSTRMGVAATTGCAAGTCTTTTVWMLDPDWGYPRGPHGKTRLVSRASLSAAAHRVARTEADALDMNLHKGSWAPAVGVQMCTTRVDAAFGGYATNWENPWNGTNVSLVDLRGLPAEVDLRACPASTALDAEARRGPVVSDELAFTGDSERRLLFLGVGAVVAGTILRALSGKGLSPVRETEADTGD